MILSIALAEFTSNEIKCSSGIERAGSAGNSFKVCASTTVSDVRRLFLDHQIRR
jgi:hypothetical protein